MCPVNSDPSSVIVILGGSNDPSGRLSQMTLDRCDQAIVTHTRHPLSRILVTGGLGKHFNETPIAHGEYLKNELVSRGIDKSLFFPVAISAYTEADATAAKEVLKTESFTHIHLITSDFHMARALHYFRLHFDGITVLPCPAPSKLPPSELEERIRHEQNRMAQITQNSPQG